MAHLVLTDAFVEINGTDLSGDTRQVTLNYEAEAVDDTDFNSSGAQEKLSGLTDWSLDVEFAQNYSSSQVDDTLFSLVGSSAVTANVRPKDASQGSTNPNYQGSVLLQSYPPLGGSVGDLATVSATFEGTGTLDRLTSST